MGSCISPLIANLFMEEFEVKTLSSVPSPHSMAKGLDFELFHKQFGNKMANGGRVWSQGPSHRWGVGQS